MSRPNKYTRLLDSDENPAISGTIPVLHGTELAASRIGLYNALPYSIFDDDTDTKIQFDDENLDFEVAQPSHSSSPQYDDGHEDLRSSTIYERDRNRDSVKKRKKRVRKFGSQRQSLNATNSGSPSAIRDEILTINSSGYDYDDDDELLYPSPNGSHSVAKDWLTQALPDEVLHRVYAHLDASSIVQTSQVNHRLNLIASQKSVWQRAAQTWSQSTQIMFATASAYSEIAKCYLKEMAFLKRQREYAERRRREFLNRVRWHTARWWLHLLFFNLAIDFLTVFSFILGTIYVALRCQEIILWPWSLVLTPFYIILLQLSVAPTAYYLCAGILESPPFLSSPGPNLWFKFVRRGVNYQKLYVAFLVNLAAFMVLLLLKLNKREGSIPAWALAIPCNIFAIVVITEQLFGWSSRNNHMRYRAVLSIASILLAIASIIVTLKIDGISTRSWLSITLSISQVLNNTVFIPLPWLGYLLYNEDPLFGFEPNRLKAYSIFYAFVYLLGFIVPLFTCAILTARNLDGAHVAWPLVFIPLFIVDANLLLNCIFHALRAL